MRQGFIAGIDLGASNVRIALANGDGEIQARRVIPFPEGAPEAALDKIGRTIDELSRGVWMSAKLAAIGMALPGAVDPATGSVASAANLPGWGDVDIARLLAAPRDALFAGENDANAAALGEARSGVAREMRTFVFMALGTGIGAGVFVDGKLHRGRHGLAGEVAFFPMMPAHIRAPGWDNCFEGVAGGRTFGAKAREILGEGGTPRALFEAARDGNDRARAWVRELQEYLAMAIVDVAALLDPDAVVVGGGVAMAQGEWLLDPIRDMVHAAAPAPTPVVLSGLGEDAQLVGAIHLAVDAVEGR